MTRSSRRDIFAPFSKEFVLAVMFPGEYPVATKKKQTKKPAKPAKPKVMVDSETVDLGQWRNIANRPMREGLEKGTTINVGSMYREPLNAGNFRAGCWLISSIYKGADSGHDYCAILEIVVPQKEGSPTVHTGHQELWIWSIGIEIDTGRVWASADARFYQAEEQGFNCAFLR